ncbi:hypothetical protein Q1695_007176 [Nippostrongylus brasiliensis]|nr:hypothetical protein Q1695_007176 [Nippostrongylus brasiliensis]
MNLVWLFIIAVFCPPLAVYIKWGCGCHLLINIFLTGFVWVLGITHAWFMCSLSSAISFKDYLVSFFDGGQKPPDDEIPVEMPDSPRLPRLARRLRNTRVQTSMSELQQMAVVEPLNTEQPFILEQRRIEDEEDHDLM